MSKFDINSKNVTVFCSFCTQFNERFLCAEALQRKREKSNERRSSPLAHSHYPCPTLPLPSLFGKTIEAKSKRVNCRIVDSIRAIKRSFDRFDFQRTIEISNNAAISIHHKKTELVDTCIYIG